MAWTAFCRSCQYCPIVNGSVWQSISADSVVPYFRQQATLGGPLTLYHQDIIRYFMSISEDAQLVMPQCMY